MQRIQVKDRTFKLYIHESEILKRVSELATQLAADLADENPLFLVLLNGSFVFASDLLRAYPHPCEMSFVRMSSYVGTQSTGKVSQLLGLTEDITGRTVVVVEDIIESGTTMQKMLEILAEKNPAKVRVASLFVKPACLKVPIDIHYRCFEISDEFIVGYGLDYNQGGRNLRHIYQVVE